MPAHNINPPYMHGYKYPPLWPTDQRRLSLCISLEVHKEKWRLKMFPSRCVLPFLALILLLQEMSAAVLPSRNKREVNWMDQELFPRLPDRSDEGDLSVGDAGEVGRDLDGHTSHSAAPTEHLTIQRHNQHNRKASEKRRKVAPLDSIGSFQMSSSRNRKDEPDVALEAFMD